MSVCRRSKTACRNSCSIVSGEMSLTDRIHPRYILSRIRVSVRPSNFLYTRKTSKLTPYTRRKPGRQCQRPAIVTSGAARHGWLASNTDSATAVCMCVQAFARVRSHACACVRPFVCTCVRACVREVFAIYDNTI